MAAAEDAATAAVKAEENAAAASASASDDYFAKARLTRQQSRDEALSLLQSASTAEGASQATIDSAMSAISAMASDSMTETQIENLLLAKDFSECVVYITDEGITVAVPAPADGLSTAQVATITDTIVKETDYTAPQIKVIEVKADAQDAQRTILGNHTRPDRKAGMLPLAYKRETAHFHDRKRAVTAPSVLSGI
ncbi:MAG: SpoIIIAH-like family protein [Oscillospiraceae bacterium]